MVEYISVSLTVCKLIQRMMNKNYELKIRIIFF